MLDLDVRTRVLACCVAANTHAHRFPDLCAAHAHRFPDVKKSAAAWESTIANRAHKVRGAHSGGANAAKKGGLWWVLSSSRCRQ